MRARLSNGQNQHNENRRHPPSCVRRPMNELLLDVDDPLITVIYGAKSECGASKLQAREFI